MAEMKAPVQRPLSPHLQIYRWTWTMAMSIFHRATGFALYLGTLLLAIWLMALALGPHAFEMVQGFFGSPIGLLILFGYTWALLHHMLGGLRHFFWDMGIGFEQKTRMALSKWTLIGSLLITALIWGAAFEVMV
jgi:succinate dehydrogenase / fumarate reductase, cytochrome b subunit